MHILAKANDNNVNPDFTELARLNEIGKYGLNLQRLKNGSPRTVSNFLWFVKYEMEYRAAEINKRRDEIVAKNSTQGDRP